MNLSFEYPLTVQSSDIDELKHVNNEVYLRWLIESATAHSASLGYTLDYFLASGAAFVVRRHELDYLLPAFLGEELIVKTWVGSIESIKSTRGYSIHRKSDGRTILKGQTLWVYIDLKTGRPTVIPESMAERYREFLHVEEPR